MTLEENWAPPEYPKTEDEERRLQVPTRICAATRICVATRICAAAAVPVCLRNSQVKRV